MHGDVVLDDVEFEEMDVDEVNESESRGDQSPEGTRLISRLTLLLSLQISCLGRRPRSSFSSQCSGGRGLP